LLIIFYINFVNFVQQKQKQQQEVEQARIRSQQKVSKTVGPEKKAPDYYGVSNRGVRVNHFNYPTRTCSR